MSGPDFLAGMAQSSRRRVSEARALRSDSDLWACIKELPPAPPLKLDGRFDLIAELKLKSPAMGVLSGSDEDLEARVLAYAAEIGRAHV